MTAFVERQGVVVVDVRVGRVVVESFLERARKLSGTPRHPPRSRINNKFLTSQHEVTTNEIEVTFGNGDFYSSFRMFYCISYTQNAAEQVN
jgi:hypothetical protein